MVAKTVSFFCGNQVGVMVGLLAAPGKFKLAIMREERKRMRGGDEEEATTGEAKEQEEESGGEEEERSRRDGEERRREEWKRQRVSTNREFQRLVDHS